MSSHVFVDETKYRGYVLATGVVVDGDLEPVRKLLRRLVLPGQRRLHMKAESDRRRRAIIATIIESGVSASIYDAGLRYRTERDRRAACLRELIADMAGRDSARLVLELDDTLQEWDRRQLFAFTRQAGVPDLSYEHARASTEPLLAIPDAIAWCWAKGGDWRRRVESVVTQVRQV